MSVLKISAGGCRGPEFQVVRNLVGCLGRMNRPYKNAQEFAEEVFDRVVSNHWFFLKNSFEVGAINLSEPGYEVLYPNQIRICDAGDFFVVEFTGGAPWENSLGVKKPKFNKCEIFPSLSQYLVPGPPLSEYPKKAAMYLTYGKPVSLTGINFVTKKFLGQNKDKFLHLSSDRRSSCIITDSPDALIIIRGTNPYVHLQDIALYSASDSTVYFRFFSLLLASHKKTPKNIWGWPR